MISAVSGRGGDQQVCNDTARMVAAFCQHQLDLDDTVFDGWRQVFDGHASDWRALMCSPEVVQRFVLRGRLRAG